MVAAIRDIADGQADKQGKGPRYPVLETDRGRTVDSVVPQVFFHKLDAESIGPLLQFSNVFRALLR